MFMRKTFLGLGVLVTIMMGCSLSNAATTSIPAPLSDEPLATQPVPDKELIVAGGCFWGIEAVFLHVKGVKNAVSGYAGGEESTATYDQVSAGKTNHAEAVKITYDSSKVTMGQLLQVFFGVAHNPTELNKQGPDHGTQYRSAVFYEDENQRKFVENYIEQLDQGKHF
ncbi:MAG: peptide-methionine (S)-S-oxide reductase MsrA, partial [Alphaproteobacteria bacterium]|nr:peptide-methionine (S)-S-oxide reductase MsrA [Alphaproteobacteria bacterium]